MKIIEYSNNLFKKTKNSVQGCFKINTMFWIIVLFVFTSHVWKNISNTKGNGSETFTYSLLSSILMSSFSFIVMFSFSSNHNLPRTRLNVFLFSKYSFILSRSSLFFRSLVVTISDGLPVWASQSRERRRKSQSHKQWRHDVLWRDIFAFCVDLSASVTFQLCINIP